MQIMGGGVNPVHCSLRALVRSLSDVRQSNEVVDGGRFCVEPVILVFVVFMALGKQVPCVCRSVCSDMADIGSGLAAAEDLAYGQGGMPHLF